MNAIKVVKLLTEKFGDRVKVCSQYHIQVESTKGSHDVWIKKDGSLKCKFAGAIESHELDFNKIVQQIQSYSYQKTHFEQMQEILDLAKFIKQSEQAAIKTGSAIFTDAGFKDGKARIAAIFVNGNEIEAKSKIITVENSSSAELAAINLGLSMHETATVYNDCQSVISSLHYDHCRIKWLPRTENKAADKIGNMRT